MGNNLFGAKISKEILKAIGPGVLPATLIKVTSGTRTPGSLTDGTNPTSVSYSGRGFVDDYNLEQKSNTLVQEGDRMVVLIGDSFSVTPETSDKITIEGSTYVIVSVMRDPDAATYTCQVR